MLIKRTTSIDPEFQSLIHQLDVFLAKLNGEEHAFYSQHNKVDLINHVVVAYDDGIAVGCGAIRQYADDLMEVKRMYVLPEQRGKKVATHVLQELETWSKELGFTKLILETAKELSQAIALYQKSGYHKIPNYGHYAGIEKSICFSKQLAG